MGGLLKIIKSLLIGGLLFLLPLGIIFFIFGQLLALTDDLGVKLRSWLLPGTASPEPALLFAILILILVALAAGHIMRTGTGRAIFDWFEKVVLWNLPMYSIYRQVLPDVGENSDQPRKEAIAPVVAVRFDDRTQIGFLVETMHSGMKVIYLHNAPSALIGDVFIVDPSRVETSDLDAMEFLSGLQRMGDGIAQALEKSEQSQPAPQHDVNS